MNRWVFAFLPLLLLVLIPADADAERLLITGQGEIQKRLTTADTEFEVIFNSLANDKRSWLEFESGSIMHSSETYFMHPSSIVRDIMNHQIFRVGGVLDNGDIFWIYGIRDGSDYEMSGKIISENNKFNIRYDGKVQSLDEAPIIVKTDPNPTVEYVPELTIAFKVDDVQFIQNDLEVMLTAFDAKKGRGGTGNVVVDNIAGVNIKVDLAQERLEYVPVDEINGFFRIIEDDWRHITTIEGKTDEHGKWTGMQLLGSKTFQQNQKLQVSITATLDEQSVTEVIEVFVTHAN